jgi:hypothetical protein
LKIGGLDTPLDKRFNKLSAMHSGLLDYRFTKKALPQTFCRRA